MGLVDKIKKESAKAGANKGKFFYVKEGTKARVRFLQDMDDGLEVIFHDSFAAGVNVPCQETFGKECPYCDDADLRTRSQYVWSVYNYDMNEVQLFMFPVNNCTPVPSLTAMYENYGTLTDRDYVISTSGKQQNKNFTVIPNDKVKFRNEKAKPYSLKTTLAMINKAYPPEAADDEEDEDDEEVVVAKKTKPSAAKGKPVEASKKKKPHVEEEEDDYEDDDETEEVDYTDMTAIELYKLCKSRDIEAAQKKLPKYYIKLLEEDDKTSED